MRCRIFATPRSEYHQPGLSCCYKSGSLHKIIVLPRPILDISVCIGKDPLAAALVPGKIALVGPEISPFPVKIGLYPVALLQVVGPAAVVIGGIPIDKLPLAVAQAVLPVARVGPAGGIPINAEPIFLIILPAPLIGGAVCIGKALHSAT